MSAMVWMVLSTRASRGPSLTATMNGMVAGLAGITPASGYIDNQGSIWLGLAIGVVTYFGSVGLKGTLGIDDALEVTTVHGLSGITGTLAVGLFASKKVAPFIPHDGLFYGGGWRLLGSQALGVSVVAVYSVVVTYLILKVIGAFLQLRVDLVGEVRQ